ncbi:MAG: hypothetical protein ACK47M_15380, partial [Caldilinea sp.]
MNERTFGWGGDEASAESHWFVRSVRWAGERWRPYLGWIVLALCLMLAMLPAALLWENRWLRSGALIGRLYLAGPLAIMIFWLVAGWRRPYIGGRQFLRIVVQGIAFLALSTVTLSQLLAGWLPGPALIGQAVVTGAWNSLSLHAIESLQ